ncbi:MAG: TIGR03915 family putative DNA repair protein [Flavobacteriaceae bacterium]
MNTSRTLVYDGSFNGFLTSIFKAFEQKHAILDIQKNSEMANELFSNRSDVKTDIALAKNVWNAISEKKHMAIKKIYFSFLSESEGIEMKLYQYIKYIMGRLKQDQLSNINELISTLDILSSKVEKEKRRMEAFVQFQLTKENVYLVTINSKYNVLPLLSKHIKQHHKGKQWQIFDARRNYGISYYYGTLQITSQSTKILQAV